ncbi:phage tail tube protein [Microbacterium sp. 5K110]|uniref:phage tail tube protein n=1 Tax=unclassified Microbacterium TaxID=2609290 RepID=UPI0010FDC0ED|nr:phage tail tube protein [Microbacterium sp. 5K110]TLF33964.1 hypothetical protein FE256_02295 [Microbacterium sp. 5K110]
MTTQLDFSVGLGLEAAFATITPATRFFESEAKAKWDVKTAMSKGLRPTKGVDRTSRQSISHVEGTMDITVDAPTRGLGFLINAVMGSVVTTNVSTGLTQQVHTLSTTDPVPTYAVQEVVPLLGGAANNAHIFRGCAFDSLTIDAKEGEYVAVTASALLSRILVTSPGVAAAYPSDDGLFSYVQGQIFLGDGVLTEPTTTALASLAVTSAVNIADFSVTVKRNLDQKGFNLGGAGLRRRAPVLGKPQITGKLTAEYTDNVLRDAYLAQTSLACVLTFTNGTAVLQVVLPAIRLGGEVPASNGGETVTQSIPFTAFDNGTATQPIWIVYRSADTAP